MADAFGMKPEDVMGMRNDAHPTNFAENVQFFLNASNPTNFERTWKNASYVYRELGRIDAPVPFDQVMDFTFIQKLQTEGHVRRTRRTRASPPSRPAATRRSQAEAPILTQTIRINFYPELVQPLRAGARRVRQRRRRASSTTPTSTRTLEQVARLSGQFARAVILIEGHTDSSMKGRVPVQAVRDLSLARAEAIKQALIEKYKFDPNKFIVEGQGLGRAGRRRAIPTNQALNRRVEISVFPPEQQ